MNFAIVLFISTIAIVAGEDTSAVDAARQLHLQLLRRRAFPFITKREGTEQPNACDPEEVSCTGDTFTFCGLHGMKQSVKCSEIFDGKPGYCDCDKSYCTASKPDCFNPECNKENEKMPYPSDCHSFTYCDGQTKSTKKCPEGFTYNPSAEMCDPRNICYNLKCNPKKIIEYIPYPQSPEYYLFCLFGESEVRRCSQKQYTMQNGMCQYNCTKPGLFRDPKSENCRKGYWYSCSNAKGNTFVMRRNVCGKDPAGGQLYFNEDIGICDKKDTCDGDTTTTTTTTTPPTNNVL